MEPPSLGLSFVLDLPDAVGDGGGTNETGLPVEEMSLMASFPNGTVVGTETSVVRGNVACEPDGTDVTSVTVSVNFVVDCSDAGQLMSPVEMHATPVCVTFVLMVVVVRSARPLMVAVVGGSADDERRCPAVTHAAASVV